MILLVSLGLVLMLGMVSGMIVQEERMSKFTTIILLVFMWVALIVVICYMFSMNNEIVQMGGYSL